MGRAYTGRRLGRLLEISTPTPQMAPDVRKKEQPQSPFSAASTCTDTEHGESDALLDSSAEQSDDSWEALDSSQARTQATDIQTPREQAAVAPQPVGGTPRSPVWMIIASTIFFGCACQAPYEVMNSRDRGCGSVITFFEYLFGLVASLDTLRTPRQLPLRLHGLLAATHLGYAMFLNLALSTSLPIPVVITMKNGNLAANMLLGLAILHRRYTPQQYVAVACITMGLVLASLSGVDCNSQGGGASWDHVFGVVCLVGALLSRAASNVVQEILCQDYVVSVKELIFYRCALGFPFVLLQWRQILEHIHRWGSEAQETSALVLPTMWLLLLTNLTFDFGMKVAMTQLIGRTSALTATLVLTCQRFLSFVVSAFALSAAPPTWDLWASALGVLSGTLLYMLPRQPPTLSRVAAEPGRQKQE